MGGLALGSISAPAIVAAIGPRAAFVVVGSILPVLTLISWRWLVRIDTRSKRPTAELDLVGAVPLFAPLSVAAKEHVAARLTKIDVAAGEVVVPRR